MELRLAGRTSLVGLHRSISMHGERFEQGQHGIYSIGKSRSFSSWNQINKYSDIATEL
jgi:hypothetical protein